MKHRNLNLDVIRCVALIYILCVHFFLNTNFYYCSPIIGNTMQLGVILRNCFTSCVPLFMILSGYLLNKKNLTLKFYTGISKVLILYGLSCIPIWIFRILYNEEAFTLGSLFQSYIHFELYGWYIGMYICLYAIIPFLNILYHNLKSKTEKIVLLVIFISLTALPSLLNRFGLFYIPVHFESLYPITYYFIGAFLFEYADDFNISSAKLFIIYVIVVILGGCFVNSHITGQYFYTADLFVDWGNLLNTSTSPILFLTLLKADFSKLPKFICKFIETVSVVSLQLYLVSYVFDVLVYNNFNAQYPVFIDKLIRFPFPIIQVFIPSFIIALLIQFIYNQIKKISTRS